MPYPVSEGPRFVPAHDVVQLEAHYSRQGQDQVNIFHVYNASPADNLPAFAAAAMNAYEAWETQAIVKGLRYPDVTFTKLVARDMGSENAPAWERSENIVGSAVGSGNPTLPTSVTIAVKLTTGLSGRSYRGRSYFIGMSNSQINGSSITTGFRDALLVAYNDLITRMRGLVFTGSVAAPNGTRLVVLSKANGKMWRDEAAKTEITGCALADLVVDVQRRRLPGRGR